MPDDKAETPAERRLRFLSDWQTTLSAKQAEALHHDRGAIDFAQSALKSAMILNGGALVLFPAYATLFDVDGSRVITATLLPSILFIAGLVLALFATCFGYFALVEFGRATVQARDKMGDRLLQSYYPSNDYKPFASKEETHWKVGNIWRWAAIICVFVSLGCFIWGSGRAVYVLSADYEQAANFEHLIPGTCLIWSM